MSHLQEIWLTVSFEHNKDHSYQMPILTAKMQQIQFQLGICPDPMITHPQIDRGCFVAGREVAERVREVYTLIQSVNT